MALNPKWYVLGLKPPIDSTDFAGGHVYSADGGTTLFGWGITPTTTGGKYTFRTVDTVTSSFVSEWEGTNDYTTGGLTAPVTSDNLFLYIVVSQNNSLGGSPTKGSVTEIDLVGETESTATQLGFGAAASAISPDDSLLCITTTVPSGVSELIPGVAQLAKVSCANPPVLLAEVATGTQLHAGVISDETKAVLFTPDGNTVVAVSSRDIYTVDVATWTVTNRLIHTDGAWPISSGERMTGALWISADSTTAYVITADVTSQVASLIDIDISTLVPGAVEYVVATDADEKSANFLLATFLIRFCVDEDYMFVFYSDAGNNPFGEGWLKVIQMSDGAAIRQVNTGSEVIWAGGMAPTQMFVAANEVDFWLFTVRPLGMTTFENSRWLHIGPSTFIPQFYRRR